VSSRPRSTPLARVLPPCPFLPRLDGASASFEVFRDRAVPPDTPSLLAKRRGSSLPSVRPRRTLSRGSIPCESPGCACRAALAVLVRRLFAGARLRLSWGSSSLRRLQLQVPRFCRDGLDPPRETRDTTPSSGSALGLLSAPRRFWPRRHPTCPSCPEPAVYAVATPWSLAALLHAATSLGFALQSLPFPRSRAASRRPSASPRVRSRS